MVHRGIEYKAVYRDIKYPRLEFKTGTLHLILPYGYKPELILEKHDKWISQKGELIKESIRDSLNKEIIQRNDEEFIKLITTFVNSISKKLGVIVNKIYYRKMNSKWASCSSNGNLTINVLMKNLPQNLIKYIIYHELTHLIEKRHNEKFWRLISKRFKNYKELEASLFSYWFLINSLEKS